MLCACSRSLIEIGPRERRISYAVNLFYFSVVASRGLARKSWNSRVTTPNAITCCLRCAFTMGGKKQYIFQSNEMYANHVKYIFVSAKKIMRDWLIFGWTNSGQTYYVFTNPRNISFYYYFFLSQFQPQNVWFKSVLFFFFFYSRYVLDNFYI